jgi:hypothetical protein
METLNIPEGPLSGKLTETHSLASRFQFRMVDPFFLSCIHEKCNITIIYNVTLLFDKTSCLIQCTDVSNMSRLDLFEFT